MVGNEIREWRSLLVTLVEIRVKGEGVAMRKDFLSWMDKTFQVILWFNKVLKETAVIA